MTQKFILIVLVSAQNIRYYDEFADSNCTTIKNKRVHYQRAFSLEKKVCQ